MTAPARPHADVERYVDLRVPAYSRQAVSRFRVLIWRRHPLMEGAARPLVVMSDAPSSCGPSITNAAEEAWAWAQRTYPGCIVIEHYPADGAWPDRCAYVHVDDRGRPSWSPVNLERLVELIVAAGR